MVMLIGDLQKFVNNIPLTGDSIIIVKKSLANILPFPLPYRYNDPSGESIKFSIEDIESGLQVDVSIYTISMDLVYSSNMETKAYVINDPSTNVYGRISIIEWDKPVNQNGENLRQRYIYNCY